LKDVKVQTNYFESAQPSDLAAYGLIPEFIGRFPLIVSTIALDEKALIDVMTKPKNSLVKQYEHLFNLNGIEFHCTVGALKEIAAVAAKRGTGARGLRAITENLLVDAFFVTPSLTDVNCIYVDRACIKGVRQPILLRGKMTLGKFLKKVGDDDEEEGEEEGEEAKIKEIQLEKGQIEVVDAHEFLGFELQQQEEDVGDDEDPKFA